MQEVRLQTRIVAGASIPTSAACIAAAFNLLAAEDIDVQLLFPT